MDARLLSLYVYILIVLLFLDKLEGQQRSIKDQNQYCPHVVVITN